MNRIFSRIRRPVKRERAERYILITLLSFAASVIVTRLYLQLTGFPKIGGGEFHIAHVLWGGLLLFVASLVPLVLANRGSYVLTAVLSGVGVGLFIDEVGKFITQNNDYFSPFAAPIIYGLFLITVFVYLQVRRPPSQDSRAEMYRALDGLMEILENDLDAGERASLEARLEYVAAQQSDQNLARLAAALLIFLESDALELVPDRLTGWERLLLRLQAIETRWIGRRTLKSFLIVALGILGVLGLSELLISALALVSPDRLRAVAVDILTSEQQVRGATSLGWFIIRMLLEGVVGAVFLISSLLLLTGRERRGVHYAVIALVLSLTTLNLLVLYFDQFTTIVLTLFQFSIMASVMRYRERFLQPMPAKR